MIVNLIANTGQAVARQVPRPQPGESLPLPQAVDDPLALVRAVPQESHLH